MLDIFPGEVTVLLTAAAIAVPNAIQASSPLFATPALRPAQTDLRGPDRRRLLVAGACHTDVENIERHAHSNATVLAALGDGDKARGAGMAAEKRQVEARA